MPVNGMLRIPKDILLPVALRARDRMPVDPEKWDTSDYERIRAECGPEWAHIPLDNIRLQCCNFRRSAKLGKVNKGGHGATKVKKSPPWYLAYLKTQWWQEFRLKVLKFWGYRCALCYAQGRLEVHHRTYERLKGEELTDCIALCRTCHKAAQRAMQRREENEEASNQLFAGCSPAGRA